MFEPIDIRSLTFTQGFAPGAEIPACGFKPFDLAGLAMPTVTGELTLEITDDDARARFAPELLHTLEIRHTRMERRSGWRGWIDWLLHRRPLKHDLVQTIPNVRFSSTPLESTDTAS